MKGKKLKEGQHVLVTRTRNRKQLAPPIVLTVRRAEFPFVVFEYECTHQAIEALPSGIAVTDKPRSEVVTLDVRGHRFKKVSDDFVAASRNLKEPDWLHEKD